MQEQARERGDERVDPVVVGLILPSAPPWNSRKIYHIGDRVYDNGATWEALWWTLDQKPGDPFGPWQEIATAPDGTAVWTPSRVFNRGDVVEYQGKEYVAQWWTRDQKPGDPWGPWKAVA